MKNIKSKDTSIKTKILFYIAYFAISLLVLFLLIHGTKKIMDIYYGAKYNCAEIFYDLSKDGNFNKCEKHIKYYLSHGDLFFEVGGENGRYVSPADKEILLQNKKEKGSNPELMKKSIDILKQAIERKSKDQ